MTATAAIQITGVDFVCIPTSDHDRACEFYGGLLGLPKVKRWGDRPATEFQAGNLTLVVFDPTGFGMQPATPNSAPIALAVDDVQASRDALQARACGSSWTGSTRASATRRSSSTPTATA